MKKLLIIIAIVNIFVLKAENNQKWEIIYDNVRGSVRNIQFFDDIIYINSVPTIFKSTDHGKSFEQLYLGTNGSMMSMCFLDKKTGWAVRYNGIVVYTSDGGKTWIDRSVNNLNRLSYVKFIDETTGWVSGSKGYLAKTTNGGQSWTDIEFDIDANFGEIKIDKENNLWLIGGKTIDYDRNESYGVLYKSTDMGDTWQKIDVPKLENIYAIEIIDNTIMLGSKNGNIYLSNDLGESWTINNTGIKTPIFEIRMKGKSTGYAAGGWAYGSSDIIGKSDGNLPTKVFKSETGGFQEMNEISDISGEFANGAIMFVTHDGGNSWQPYSWFKDWDHIFGININKSNIYLNGGNRGRVLKLIE